MYCFWAFALQIDSSYTCGLEMIDIHVFEDAQTKKKEINKYNCKRNVLLTLYPAVGRMKKNRSLWIIDRSTLTEDTIFIVTEEILIVWDGFFSLQM